MHPNVSRGPKFCMFQSLVVPRVARKNGIVRAPRTHHTVVSSTSPILAWRGGGFGPTHKQHPPQPAQPRHTNDAALRTRKQHQQERKPQQPTKRSDPMQHAKGRTGDCPGPRKETAPRRNVTQGGGAKVEIDIVWILNVWPSGLWSSMVSKPAVNRYFEKHSSQRGGGGGCMLRKCNSFEFRGRGLWSARRGYGGTMPPQAQWMTAKANDGLVQVTLHGLSASFWPSLRKKRGWRCFLQVLPMCCAICRVPSTRSGMHWRGGGASKVLSLRPSHSLPDRNCTLP